MSASHDSSAQVLPQAWMQVALVFVFMVINYADKAVVGLASVPIMRELSLSHAQFGLLGSAFFLLFQVSGITVGLIADRVSTKLVMFVMAVIWAAALLPVAFYSGFTLLLASRVILGAAEGPSFPVAMHAVYKWFKERRRALPGSVVASGAAFGTGVIAPAISWLILRHGWHAAFLALGIAGILWSGLWLMLGREGIGDGASASTDATPPRARRIALVHLLSSRTALGVFIAGFAAYWAISLNIVWLANYLRRGLNLDPQSVGWLVALPSVMQMVISPTLAWWSQRTMARGTSSRLARGLLGGGCVFVCGLSMVIMALIPWSAWKVVAIGLCFSIGSVIFTLGGALIGEITPSTQRGGMLGITNSIHTLAGLLAPVIMGGLIDAAASTAAGFERGFILAGAGIAVCGAIAAVCIDPRRDLERFSARAAAMPPS